MATRPYAGTWTAIITPFQTDGTLDEQALRGIVQAQIAGGVTGVVPMGTTGESPTISEDESERILEIVMSEAKGKILVMAGTGSNDTHKAVKNTKLAKKMGVDACLIVCPYYNKPTPEGIRLHFLEIAKIGLPIIVYNIKGRTGINISTDTLMELAKNEFIVGVKEASGDVEQMREVIRRRPENFTVLCGDDGLTLELIKMGGDGVISVASNIVPEQISRMVSLARAGNFDSAGAINSTFTKLFKDLFMESNPIPVKYASYKMGKCALQYRLPMCEPTETTKKMLDETLKFYQLIERT